LPKAVIIRSYKDKIIKEFEVHIAVKKFVIRQCDWVIGARGYDNR
jgi:hypothetical protein